MRIYPAIRYVFNSLVSLIDNKAIKLREGKDCNGESDVRQNHKQREVLPVFLFICLLFFSGTSIAEEQVFDIEIPAQDAASSLEMLAEQTGAITLFPYDVASSAQANAVKGRYTLEDALNVLLKDSGLLAGLSNQRVITIEEMMKAPNEKEEQAMLKPPSKTSKVLAFISSLIVGGGSAAHESTKPEDHLLEELVVTARMKEETLLTTPVSMSVFESADMWDAGITSVVDLAEQTPGFQIENDLGRRSQRPVIRGIENSRPDASQPVAIYVDGIYTRSGIYSSITESLERVEILKGPQSALYGRSATAGVVNYITRKPTNELTGGLSASYAEHDNQELDAFLAGPVSDSLSASLGMHHYQYGGEYKNVATLTDGARRVGSEKTSAVYGAVYFQPNDQLELVARAYYSEDEDGQFAAQSSNELCPSGFAFSCVVSSPDFLDVATSLPSGSLLGEDSGGSVLSQWDFKAGLDRKISRASIGASYEFTNGLTLEWLGAYTEEDFEDVANQFYSSNVSLTLQQDDPLVVSNVTDEDSEIEYYSNELRLNGSAKSIDWMLGLFSYQEDRKSRARLLFIEEYFETARTKLSESSIYGYLSWGLSSNLSLNIEGRLTKEVASGETSFTNSEVENTAFNPRISVEYLWSEQSFLYSSLSSSEGFIGHNFNADSTAPLRRNFGKEVVEQFDMGIKTTFFQGHMRLQAAAFILQQTEKLATDFGFFPGAVQYFQIATPARDFPNKTVIHGIELDYDWLINDYWSVAASYALSDSEFSSGETFSRPLDGLQRARVPKHAVNTMVQFSYPLSDSWISKSRVNAKYNSSRIGEIDPFSAYVTGSELNLDLRTSLSKENLEFSVWVENVLDEDTPTNTVSNKGFGFGSGYVTFLPRGRQAGVSLKYSF